MAEGQTGEGMTAETQALSTENAQNPPVFPSSVICFANATFPQGKAIYTFKFQFILPGTCKNPPPEFSGGGFTIDRDILRS